MHCNDPECKYPKCDCWERKNKLCLRRQCDADLGRFYGVDRYEDLVDAQARHIEKLQEKLNTFRPTGNGRPGIVRG